MLTDLIADIDNHLAWRAAQGRPLADSTFGLLAVDDGKLVGRLKAGGQVTIGKLDAIRAFIERDRKAIEAEADTQEAAA